MHNHFNKNQKNFVGLSLVIGIILGFIGNTSVNNTAYYFVEIFINLLKLEKTRHKLC